MKIPQKALDLINEEALKYASFAWYQGWEKSSGYIKSELSNNVRYGTCRIYIKWEKKKPPTDKQTKNEIEKAILRLCNNEEHHSIQRDFVHYVQQRFYFDTNRLKHQVMLSVVDCLPKLIKILEAPLVDFGDLQINELHNDLKNLECVLDDERAIDMFLSPGRKRIGES